MPHGHLIVATAYSTALQQNDKGILAAGDTFGPLVFELKITLVHYATEPQDKEYSKVDIFSLLAKGKSKCQNFSGKINVYQAQK